VSNKLQCKSIDDRRSCNRRKMQPK